VRRERRGGQAHVCVCRAGAYRSPPAVFNSSGANESWRELHVGRSEGLAVKASSRAMTSARANAADGGGDVCVVLRLLQNLCAVLRGNARSTHTNHRRRQS